MAESCQTFLLQVPGFIWLHSMLLGALSVVLIVAVRIWENWRLRKMRNRVTTTTPAPAGTGVYVQMTIDEILNPPTCPNCGGPMLLRTAVSRSSFGSKFWGCHDFPKCRGTRSAKFP